MFWGFFSVFFLRVFLLWIKVWEKCEWYYELKYGEKVNEYLDKKNI